MNAPVFVGVIWLFLLGLVLISIVALPRKWKLVPIGIVCFLLLAAFIIPVSHTRTVRMAEMHTSTQETEEVVPRVSARRTDRLEGRVAVRGGRAESGDVEMLSIPEEMAQNRSSSLRPAWTEQADANADVYPSMRSAAVAVSKTLLRSLDTVVAEGERLARVRVLSNLDEADLAHVVRAVRPFVGEADLDLQKSDAIPAESEPVAPETAILRIATEPSSSRADAALALSAALSGTAGRKQIHTTITAKPWVEDPDGYRQTHVGGREVFAIDSGLEKSPHDALERAHQAAAATLLPHLKSHLRRSYPDVPLDRRSESEWIGMLMENLGRGRLVLDTFNQQIRNPYGTVYRQVLLVDASDPGLGAIAGEQARELRGRQHHLKQMILSAAGLVFVICAMYFFLNAATKGYYAWALRLFGAIAVVAGIAFIFVVA